jgi:Transglutaminase-like superfamily
MSLLVMKAYSKLVHFDLCSTFRKFEGFYNEVRSCPIASHPQVPGDIEMVCAAVDMACIWYWKQVLCLQRSACTTFLLKSLGVRAQLVIGVQQIPFKAHAWVEVDGRVVNDKPYMPEIYAVLDRC